MMNLARFSVGHRGRGHRRARVPARGSVCEASACRAGQPELEQGGTGRRSSSHPDVRRMLLSDARADRGDARTRVRHGGGARQRAPASGCRGAQAPSGVRRSDDPGRQGLVHRDRRRKSHPPACRSTAEWASSRRPAPRSIIATRASSTIYEGTTGIQANDLVGRKTARDGGKDRRDGDRRDAHARRRAGESRRARSSPRSVASSPLRSPRSRKRWIGWSPAYGGNSRAAHAASVPYLKLWGLTAGGWQMARAALIAARGLAEGRDAEFHRAKIATARFYADYHLPQTTALKHAILTAGETCWRSPPTSSRRNGVSAQICSVSLVVRAAVFVAILTLTPPRSPMRWRSSIRCRRVRTRWAAATSSRISPASGRTRREELLGRVPRRRRPCAVRD